MFGHQTCAPVNIYQSATRDLTFSCAYIIVQGTISAEEQAVAVANGSAVGSTAYLNLESGNCHGDASPLSALIEAGVSRVVVGLRHPLQHLRGEAVQLLRSRGVTVGESQSDSSSSETFTPNLRKVHQAENPCPHTGVSRTLGNASLSVNEHAGCIRPYCRAWRHFQSRNPHSGACVGDPVLDLKVSISSTVQ